MKLETETEQNAALAATVKSAYDSACFARALEMWRAKHDATGRPYYDLPLAARMEINRTAQELKDAKPL